ncbi:DUF4399 domain-containing protein [Natrialbaceae archaeon A-CW2]|uniref:DUF4399 domain-containing protein n=1 Tax=Natronosalvus hydrolyticus TaxID=2979988 RepID=A0AAP3E552_9EURY|nr:DUF4399 domain-containing protein [Natronosalvus amylolyticus]MCU4750625.1 DUF4399 domain-containing protein [Halobacteria archaeon AArc-curdl1]
MESKRYSRRWLLAATGSMSAVAIAGCADEGPGDDEVADDVDDDLDDDEMEDDTDDVDEDEMEDDTDDTDDTEDDDDEEYDIDDQPDDAAAMFVTPQDGDTVESPVQIEAEVEGVELVEVAEPAAGEAHLHVLVDRECFDDGEVAPGPSEEAEEDGIYHWGDGSSEGEIEMEPGERELCLQLADGAHRVFGETDEITITVEE